MKREKRTEIVVERERVVVIWSLPARETVWCKGCGGLSRMASVDEAAAIVHAAARTIFQSIEAGQTHSTETTEGRLLVCLTSLFETF